jgi:hypothetical protein
MAQAFIDDGGDGALDSTDVGQAGEHIFIDLNNDGQFNPGEPSGITSDRGEVLFEGLSPGTYTLRADPLPGYQFSSPADGSRKATITAGVGATAAFGFTKRAAITGVVFNDANGNGIRDAGEVTLSGRVVQLRIANLAPNQFNPDPVQTDASGVYRFQGLTPGTYYIKTVPPSGWVQTSPPAAGSLAVTLTEVQTASVDLGQSQVAAADIRGTAFEDPDGNGVKAASEPGAYKRVIYIDANNNGVMDPTEANVAVLSSNGTYDLGGLPAGTYTVRMAPRNGWSQTTPAADAGYTVTLAAGAIATGKDFGTQKVDFTPPDVAAATFFTDSGGPAMLLQFTEGIVFTQPTSLNVVNMDNGFSALFDPVYDPIAHTATFRPRDPIASLRSGNYRAVMQATLTDEAGNYFNHTYVNDFVVLPGDANGDRSVDFGDLVVLAQNYNATTSDYAKGDFNHDGKVDFNDLVTLAQNYGAVVLPLPAAPLPAGAVQTPGVLAPALSVSGRPTKPKTAAIFNQKVSIRPTNPKARPSRSPQKR